VTVAREVASLAGGAAAQRRLLSAAGVSLPWRTVSGVVIASTGLARVMPAGPVAGGAWQAAASSPLADAAKLVPGVMSFSLTRRSTGRGVVTRQVRGHHRIVVIGRTGTAPDGMGSRRRVDECAAGPRVRAPFDSTRGGLVSRQKVPGLRDRRQRCQAQISRQAFDGGSGSSPAD